MTQEPFALSPAEQVKLAAFLKGPAAKLIAAGAKWALVFSFSGIGIGVTATAKLGDAVIEEDITDYSCW